MSVIVYGPQGCGKSKNAEVMMAHFGLKHLIDNGEDGSGNSWSPGDPIPEDTLVLTFAPDLEGALSFDDVMAAMKATSV
jgi:hypothetical protein